MQRRTRRYPTRSCVNRAPINNGVDTGSSTSNTSISSPSSSSSSSGSERNTRRPKRTAARSRSQRSSQTHTSNNNNKPSNPIILASYTFQQQTQPPASMHQQGRSVTQAHSSAPLQYNPTTQYQQQQQHQVHLPLNHSTGHPRVQIPYGNQSIQYQQQQHRVPGGLSVHHQGSSLSYGTSNTAGFSNSRAGQPRYPANIAHHNGTMLQVPSIIMPNMNGSSTYAHHPTPSNISHTQNHSYPTYSMPRQNDIIPRGNPVKFLKLNSYEDVRALINPRTISQSNQPGNSFRINDISYLLADDSYKVFLRFCKPSNSLLYQLDCLPKSFNLMINQAAFQVKNKYTFAPYDITTRIQTERSNEVFIRISIDMNQNESQEDFYFGLFLVKKIDHKLLFEAFKRKFINSPTNPQISIDLAKKKLNPSDNDDEIAIVANDNMIKVSLLCPLSSTRIKLPARSSACDHVHCFDAESFIKMNEITPRWKCPHCKIFIKFDELILDGFFSQILRQAPSNCVEADIFPDGNYEFIYDNSKPAITSAASAPATSSNPTSSQAPKRKFSEEDIKDVKDASITASPTKVAKMTKEVECITIDDSDDEENAASSSSSTINSDSNDRSKTPAAEDSDDDCVIVYESGPSTSASNNNVVNGNSSSGSHFLNNHNTYSSNNHTANPIMMASETNSRESVWTSKN